jgi:RimJ/RimL family protein N-acetyltransferase
MIVGKRIRLRLPETREDHVLQIEWRNDPEIKPYFYDDEPVSMEVHMRWWEKVSTDSYQRFYMIDAVTEPSDPYELLEVPIPIGTTSLLQIDWRNRTAEYGRLMIGDANYRGKGGGFALEAEVLLMRHAFDSLNLHRVWGHVLDYNERVMNLHHKVGFKEEGRLRDHIYKNGCYYDIIAIGLLAEEFKVLFSSTTEE